jgi:uncharacterized protein (TIGR03437 family)
MQRLIPAILLLTVAANAAPVRALPGIQLPYTFELNQGQTDPRVQYLARGNGHTLFLTNNGAVMRLKRAGESARTLRMTLQGGHEPAGIDALDASPTRSNYFVGKDGAQWRRDVPHFSRVRYRSVYKGIDLVYHSSEGQLEYDFVVAPGAAAEGIAIRFDGADQIRVNRAGELELALGGRTLVHRQPVAYQEVAGQRRMVPAAYEVRDGAAGFRLGAYDHELPLVIDPVVVYSTYIGGNLGEMVNAVAVDKDGNTYLTGETNSIDFPVVGTPIMQPRYSLSYSFVVKVNAAGNKILFSSYIGGSSNTRGLAIAVDSDANVYLGGVTGARDFPLANPTQNNQPGLNIGYVMKLNPQGDKLLFSTYIGGERNDRVDALAIDGQGSIYVTGYASSTTLPVVNAFQPKIGGSSDGLVAKFAAPNYRLAYCSYLGGVGVDEPYGIAVDSSGSAFVTGYTWSPNLATTGAYQTKMLSSGDGFLLKVRPAGDTLAFYTYLGGANEDHPQALALDNSGNPVIVGSTSSKNYPVSANAIQKELKGYEDVFLTKLDANGTSMVYSTYLGGTQPTGSHYLEEARGVAVDRQGNMVVTGVTNSSDFPRVRSLQAFGGGTDAFLFALDPAGDKILYSTPIGGAKDEVAHGLAIDPSGAVYVGGHSLSADFPLKAALRSAFAGNEEGFLTKICDPTLILSPNSLTFVKLPGNEVPAAQNVAVNACTAIPFTVASTGAFLKVTPTSGNTNASLAVSVDATSLTPGDYKGTITVTAVDAINSPQTVEVLLHVAPPPPAITGAGVLNAASSKGGPVSAGELLVIYGNNVGPEQLAGTRVDGDRVVGETGNTRVLFDGVPGAMIYAASGQVSAIVPYSVHGKTNTKVEVERFGVRSNAVTMQVAPASPALFTLNSAGFGQGAILNQDASVNGEEHPAERGSIVILYATGEGQTDPGGVDGKLALQALPKPMQSVRVSIGGQQAEILYAGAAPSMVAGVMQINVKVPEGSATGSVPVRVTVGSVESPATVTMVVR